MAASTSSTRQWSYDVFISFRGEETRNTFTGHLHRALVERGINTFIDYESLRRGQEISHSLYQAIEESRICIVVFSRDYAASKWCLDELVKIMDCRKSTGQMIRPVFYNVDPSDVRNQSGTYEVALAKHEKVLKKENERVKRWRQVLTEAANLSGWHLANGHEPKFIQNIVEEVSSKLNRARLQVAAYPVGIDSRALSLNLHLTQRQEDVHMVGICGFGGIGKTTIAKAIYNRIADDFEGSSFLANVRDSSKPSDLVQLQERLLFEVLGDKNLKVGNVDRGVHLIRDRLQFKRVAIVIDDVDHMDQLRYLAGRWDWFGSGSRIIITTRDKHLLEAHGVKAIYKVKKLNDAEAHQLFMWYAFKEMPPMAGFEQLASEVLRYCNGLPLALIVLGSHLCGRKEVAWRGELQTLKRLPHKDIYEILKISYDGLNEYHQAIFLDIAFFFNGKDEGYVHNILESCDVYPSIGIPVLVDKCLIKIEDQKVYMHNLIQEMGKEIVRRESPNEPGLRSRLWFYEDILQVLTRKNGTNRIHGIKLDMPETEEIQLSTNALSEMKGLKLLMCNVALSGSLEYLPNELGLLDFSGYSSPLLAPKSLPKKLVSINISRSLIKELGNAFKNFMFLKHIHFKSCNSLWKIPDLSMAPNLETLMVEDCEGLVEVHNSIGFLNKLVELKLTNCQNLTTIPKRLKLKALEKLYLHGCSKQETFPEKVEEMGSLKLLDLGGTPINKLTSWIGGLSSLQDLHLMNCRFLTKIPDLSGSPNLKTLNLNGCNSLIEVHHSIGFLYNLSVLDLQDCADLTTFPKILKLKSLTHLDLSGCHKIDKLPEEVEEMGCLNWLGLERTSITQLPSWIENLSGLKGLNLNSCKNITHLGSGISKLKNLTSLNVSGCKRLKELVDLPSSVKVVEAENCESLKRFSWLERTRVSGVCRYNFANDWSMMDYWGKISKRDMELVEDSDMATLLYPRSEIPKWLDIDRERSWEATIVDTTKQIVSMKVPWQILKNPVAITFSIVVGPGPRIAQFFGRIAIWHMGKRLTQAKFVPLESDHVWIRRLNKDWIHDVCLEGLPRRDDQMVFSFIVESPITGNVVELKKCAVHLTLDSHEENGSNEQYQESTSETLHPDRPLEYNFFVRVVSAVALYLDVVFVFFHSALRKRKMKEKMNIKDGGAEMKRQYVNSRGQKSKFKPSLITVYRVAELLIFAHSYALVMTQRSLAMNHP